MVKNEFQEGRFINMYTVADERADLTYCLINRQFQRVDPTLGTQCTVQAQAMQTTIYGKYILAFFNCFED